MNKIKTYTFVLLIQIMPLSIFAQILEIDSLKKQLDTITGKERILLYNNIAFKYWTVAPDSGLVYAREALRMADELEYKFGKAISLESIGTNLWSKGSLDSALHYYILSNKLLKTYDDPQMLLSSYGNIANIYMEEGFYQKALDYYYEILQIIDLDTTDYSKNYYYGFVYSSMGETYFELKQYEKSLNFFAKSLVFSKLEKEADGIVNVYNNIGNALKELHKVDQAEFFYKKAYELAVKEEIPFRIVNNALALGLIYLDRDKISKAAPFLNLAAENAELLDSKMVWVDLYDALTKLNKRQGNFEQALKYAQLKESYQDSLQKENVSKRIVDIDKQAQETQLQELKIQKEKTQIIVDHQERIQIVLFAGIIASLIVVGLIFLIYRRTKESEGSLKIQNKNIEYQKNEIEEVLIQLSELSAIGKVILSSLSAVNIVKTVYEQLEKLMNVETFGIGIYNKQLDTLSFNGVFEYGRLLPDFEMQLSEDRLASWCFKNQQSVFINDYFEEHTNYVSKLSDSELALESRSVIYIPITTANKKIGVVTLQNRRANLFSQKDFSFLQNMALYIGIALDNAEAYEQLNKEIQTKNKLFSVISHDLRSPIGAIYSLTDFTLSSFDELGSEGVYQNIQLQNTAAQSALDLLENLLLWTKQQSHGIKFEPKEIQLEKVVNEILELNKTALAEKNIQIKKTIPNNITTRADLNMLKTIVRNLLSNAIKFTKENGLIQIIYDSDNQNNYIHVKDNGVGMNAEQIEQLFDSKENKSTPGTANESGSGLGLLLSQEFAQAHKGEIRVSSVEKVGSEFTLIIPKNIY